MGQSTFTQLKLALPLIILLTLLANFYFVLVPVLGEGATPKISGQANSHFLLYAQSVSGYVMTDSLTQDYCYAEHQEDIRPRFHLSFLFYGLIQRVVQDPFWTHALGNFLFVGLSILVAVFASRLIYDMMAPGLILGAAMFFNWDPHNILVKLPLFALRAFTDISHGTFGLSSFAGQLLMSSNLIISRTPIVLCIIFSIYLFVAYVASKKKRSLILLAVVLAISLAVQIHGGLIMSMALFLVFGFLFLRREVSLGHIAIFGMTFGVFALPYLLFIKKVSSVPQFADVLYWAFDVYFGRQFAFPPLLGFIAMLAFVCIIWFTQKNRAIKFLACGLLIASLIGTNLQVILGSNPVVNNWWQMAYTILAALMLSGLFQWFKDANWSKLALNTVLVSVALLLAAQGLAVYAQGGQDSYFTSDTHDVFSWMKNTIPADAVVLASPKLSPLVTTYALKKSYLCQYYQTTVGFEENAIRYLDAEWAFGDETSFAGATPYVKLANKPVNWKVYLTTHAYSPAITAERDSANTQYSARAEAVLQGYSGALNYRADYALLESGKDTLRACIDSHTVYANNAYEVRVIDSLARC